LHFCGNGSGPSTRLLDINCVLMVSDTPFHRAVGVATQPVVLVER
jgi:hypothetical protein